MFPESRVTQSMRALEGVETHIRFNFLGGRGTDASTRLARGWVERFALKHFDENDVLVFTDSWQAHSILGPWDRTRDTNQNKWNPKLANDVLFIRDTMNSQGREEWVAHLRVLGRGQSVGPSTFREVAEQRLLRVDVGYVQMLCASGATLAPAGDNAWSRRFYEAILAGSIPIIKSVKEDYSHNAYWFNQLGYTYFTTGQVARAALPGEGELKVEIGRASCRERV